MGRDGNGGGDGVFRYRRDRSHTRAAANGARWTGVFHFGEERFAVEIKLDTANLSDPLVELTHRTRDEREGEWGGARAEREANSGAMAMPPHWPIATLPLPEAVELLDRTVDRPGLRPCFKSALENKYNWGYNARDVQELLDGTKVYTNIPS
jgi:hypothetical protein